MDQDQSFIPTLGINTIAWREDFSRIPLEIKPWQLKRGGVIHGGILMTLLDFAGGTYLALPLRDAGKPGGIK